MKWAQKNKNVILWALTIIVIILIIIFSKPGDKTNNKDVNVNSDEQSETEQGGAGEAPETVATEGGDVYDFSGIQWEFDTTDPSVPFGETWLKMRFADFTRNGSVITLRNPYKLGFQPGVCSEIEFIDTTIETGIPLTYVECKNDSITRNIVVFQEMNNIVVKFMDTKEGVSDTTFSELYKINITTIVQ